MPYANTIGVKTFTISGRRHFIVTIEEEDTAAASEVVIANLPSVLTLKSIKTEIVSGTATTVQPALGTAPSFAPATVEYLGGQLSAVPFLIDQTPLKVYLPAGVLVLRSTPDAGADNEIVTELVLVEGHQD
jgi:hypothetical protein